MRFFGDRKCKHLLGSSENLFFLYHKFEPSGSITVFHEHVILWIQMVETITFYRSARSLEFLLEKWSKNRKQDSDSMLWSINSSPMTKMFNWSRDTDHLNSFVNNNNNKTISQNHLFDKLVTIIYQVMIIGIKALGITAWFRSNIGPLLYNTLLLTIEI